MHSLSRVARQFRRIVPTVCLVSTAAHAQTSRLDATAAALDSWITNTETHVVLAADAMPAERFDFAPSPAMGLFGDVRTFGQQVKHLAANNYAMAARITGREPSADEANETGPDSVLTKAQIIEYVRGSFAALHRAVATIDATKAVAPIASSSTWQRTRLSFIVDAVAHSFDHYGQMVEYLRMNGIVPPDSRPRNTRPGAEANRRRSS